MRTADRVLAALLVAGLALTACWELLKQPWGVGRMPRPDALEYAASAQALADSGTFFLQVGPHRVRPRYSPGWPLLLAAAARAGVPPGSLWRTSGWIAAALAALLALLAGEAAARLAAAGPPGPMPGRQRRAFWVAVLVTGGAWALGPGPVCLGGTLLSDHAATLAAIVAIIAGALCLLVGGSPLIAGGAGLATGAALAIRPVEGALLAVPFGLWAGFEILHRRRGWLARLAWMAGGVTVVGCGVALVLSRSGLEPWRWSDYQLWLPGRFGPRGDVFDWRYAVVPDTSYLRGSWEPYSHASIGARVLLGFEGLPFYHYAGLHWPLAGWLALLALAVKGRRALALPSREVSLAAGGLLLWTLAHFVLYSCYFFPAGRFYLAPLALAAVGLGAVCGLAAAAGGSAWAMALVGAALVAASAARTIPNLREYRQYRPPPEETRVAVKVARWRALDDRQRAQRTLRFDPVVAQAEGLLPGRVLADIGAWGKLPPTLHVLRLVEAGMISPDEVAWGRRSVRRREPGARADSKPPQGQGAGG